MRKRLLVLSLLCIMAYVLGLAQTKKIESHIVDAQTGDPLPFASVFSSCDTTITNSEGLFRIEVAKGDVLKVSFVGYGSVTIDADKFPAIIMLHPVETALGEVTVKSQGMVTVDDVIKSIRKQMKWHEKDAANYLYRQTTQINGHTTSLIEAFMNAHSAVSLRNMQLITGRFSESDVTNEGLSYSANFYTLSQIELFRDDNRIPLYECMVPLFWDYAKYYDVSRRIADDGDRRIMILHFKPKQKTIRRIIEGTLFVDAGSLMLLKAEGNILNDVIVHNYGQSDSRDLPVDIRFMVDYDNSHGFCEVHTISLDASYSTEQDEYTFRSIFYNVSKRDVSGGRKLERISDLRRQIAAIGFDADFWQQNEIVKRTAEEERLSNIVTVADAYIPSETPIKAKAGDENAAFERLRSYVKNISRFNYNFPQEKVYLHFDNTGYFRGETMWFKAYVVRADNMRYTDMSGVLYVELLNPTGDVIETRKLKIEDGQACGSIKLDNLFTSGFYEVRAYTRYMTNWDGAGIFSRVFPIFNTPKKEGDYSRPVIDEISHRKRLPDNRTLADSQEGTAAVKDGRLSVRFYPEGGRLVQGLRSRVAFDVMEKNGAPADVSGFLTMPDGTKTSVSTLREGRGVFEYTPSESPGVLTLTDSKGRVGVFTLPDAGRSGCVLSVDAVSGGTIEAVVSCTADVSGTLGIVLVNSGNVEAFSTIEPAKSPSGCSFCREDMTEGVNQIAVINENGDILAERMVFVYPKNDADTIGIAMSGGAISPCGKITLDATTRPKTTFSLSVRDYDAEVNGAEGNAATYLLLSSDLKGYINNPDYYLESDDETHRRAADLLMLVQGWRRYDLSQMMHETTLKANRPIEDRLLLTGLLHQISKKYGVSNVSLSATLYNASGASLSGKATTDSVGRYAFSLPDCEGEWTLLLNTKLDDKAVKYGVGIDRNFAPSPRKLCYGETLMLPLLRPLDNVREIEDFEEHIPLKMTERTHQIKEVKVKGRRIFDNARAAWESERQGAYKAVLRYDCQKAVDEYADKGTVPPGIFEWLMMKNNLFGGDHSSMASMNIVNNTDTLEYRYSGRTRTESAKLPISLSLSEGGGIYTEQINTAKIHDSFKKTPALTEIIDKEVEVGHKILLQKEGLSYNNHPIVWILNNRFYTLTMAPSSIKLEDYDLDEDMSTDLMPDDLDDFKSVYISENEDIRKRYVHIDGLDRYSPFTVFLYSYHDLPAKHRAIRRTHFDGYSKAETFDMPDYSLLPSMADHRRTLYWNPNVETDKDGRAEIEFYNNSTCRRIVVSAEGITRYGKAVIYK